MPVRLDEQLTPRISLRSALPEDAAGLLALIEADREYLDEWIPWVGAIRSVDEMKSIIEDRKKGKDGKGPAFCMLYEGKVAGWVSFLSIAEQPTPHCTMCGTIKSISATMLLAARYISTVTP